MRRNLVLCAAAVLLAQSGLAQDQAFKINNKSTSVKDLYKEHQSSFFKIEEEKYQLIEQLAYDAYLTQYWQNLAKKTGKSVDASKKEYLSKNATVSEQEIKATMDQFKEHPELKKLSKEEQTSRIKEYLADRKERAAIEAIISAAVKNKELQVLYPKPKEPVYTLTVEPSDNVRYGTNDDDITPKGCSNDCPITVVEYSEFQCPFCERVIPASKRLLKEYEGKVRWVVRDFPLSFHNRARPAAIAAHCAAKQGKFWHYYASLFANQTSLGDADFEKYAGKIKGLDAAKWKECVKAPGDIASTIDKNIKTGSEYGVSGTPAFFINGRKLSGALPYDEFKRVFEEELSSKKKS